MDAVLLRLLWALPLVIATGVLVIWLLKKAGLGEHPQGQDQPPRVLHQVALTQTSHAVVLQIGTERYLVVESDRPVNVCRLGSGPQVAWQLEPRAMTRVAGRATSS